MQPEIVAPVDVVAQLHLQLAQHRESLPVDELRFQDLVCRPVHHVVVGTALLGERALYAESTQQPSYRRVVELRAPAGMEDLYVAQREIQRREHRFDQAVIFVHASRIPHNLALELLAEVPGVLRVRRLRSFLSSGLPPSFFYPG